MTVSTNCLVCQKPLISPESPDGTAFPVLERQLKAFFVLRVLLKVPTKSLSTCFHLSNGDNPEDWVTVCDVCEKLVEQGNLIYGELISARRKLKRVQKEISDRIRESTAHSQPVITTKLSRSNKSTGKDLEPSQYHRQIAEIVRNAVLNDHETEIPSTSGDLVAKQLLAWKLKNAHSSASARSFQPVVPTTVVEPKPVSELVRKESPIDVKPQLPAYSLDNKTSPLASKIYEESYLEIPVVVKKEIPEFDPASTLDFTEGPTEVKLLTLPPPAEEKQVPVPALKASKSKSSPGKSARKQLPLKHPISKNRKLYICYECEKTFPTQNKHHWHMKKFHYGIPQEEREAKRQWDREWYHRNKKSEKCPQCDYRGFGCTLKKHINRVHNPNFNFSCDLCPRKFKLRQDWRNHMISLTHNKCLFDQCPTACKSREELWKHQTTVHGKEIDIFKCPHCAKVFARSSEHKRFCKKSRKKEVILGI